MMSFLNRILTIYAIKNISVLPYNVGLVQFKSVAQLCPTLCNPMDCSMPGFPVHYQCPLLLLPSIFPSIRVFPKESAFRIRWPKYWSFSFSISPSNEYLGLISFSMDWLNLLAVKGLSRVFPNTIIQKH